jgi:Zn-dependent protease/CBS domain-containing protein
MARRPYHLITVRGIPVQIDASWIVIAALITWSLATQVFPALHPGQLPTIYWVMAVLGALGLFASIVGHEIAHAVMAQRQGIPMSGITLFIFGGVAQMEGEPPTPKAEFAMAIAGPLASIGLAFALFAAALLPLPGALVTLLTYLGVTNVALAAFNLLPAFPLDGGRVARALLWRRLGSPLLATRIAARVGRGFALVLMGVGAMRLLFGDLIGGAWLIVLGFFLRQAADMSYEQLLVQQALAGKPVRQFMTVAPVTVKPETSMADFLHSFVYRYHHRLFPVADNGRLLGAISTDQLRRVPGAERIYRKVGTATIPLAALPTVSPDTGALQALGRMRETGRSRLLVVDHDRLAGIITTKDLLDFISLEGEVAQ